MWRERPIDSVVREDQLKGSQIVRGRGRPRETITKYLKINDFNRDMILYDRTSSRLLIHVADPTWWDKV
jgi:hypothetical protein